MIFGNVNLDLMYALPHQTVARRARRPRRGARVRAAAPVVLSPDARAEHAVPSASAAAAGRRHRRRHRGRRARDARGRRLPALRDVGVREAGPRVRAQPQLLALRRLPRHRRRRALEAVVPGPHRAPGALEAAEAVPRAASPTARRCRRNVVVARDDVGFEFMLNALRLTDGVPATLFAERTGYPLSLVAQRARRRDAQGPARARSDRRCARRRSGRRFLNDLQELFLADAARGQCACGAARAGRSDGSRAMTQTRSTLYCADDSHARRRAAIAGGTLTARRARRRAARAHRRDRRRDRRVGDARSRARARRSATRCDDAREVPGPLARHRRRRQGHHRHRRPADDDGLADLRGPPAGAGCGVRRAPARRRRVRVRQDGDHAVRVHGPGQDAQSVGPGAHAGRLVVGLGGGGGGGPRARGDRHADQRLGDAAGRVLRRRRVQADGGRDPVRGRHRVQPDVRHGRHVHAHGRRCGAARERARRSRRASRAAIAPLARRAAPRVPRAISRGSQPDCDADARRRRGVRTTLRDAADVVPRRRSRSRGAMRTPCTRTIMLYEGGAGAGARCRRASARACRRRSTRRSTRVARSATRPLRGAWPGATRRSRSSPNGSTTTTRCWRRRRRARRRAASTRPATRRAARCGRCSAFRRSPSRSDSSARLPIGLQLAAPQGRDDALLAVAAWCEARLPFRGPRVSARTRRSASPPMKRAKLPRAAAARRSMRNPVARSPLLGKGGRARQDDGARSAGRPTSSCASSQRDPHTEEMIRPRCAATTSSRGACASSTSRRSAARATRSTTSSCRESLTTTLAARPKGAGWWVFAYGSLLWNPLFPFVEARPGAAARPAPALLPVVDGVARHAGCARPGARARSRRRVHRRRVPAAGAGRDRRAAPAVAARDGRRARIGRSG